MPLCPTQGTSVSHERVRPLRLCSGPKANTHSVHTSQTVLHPPPFCKRAAPLAAVQNSNLHIYFSRLRRPHPPTSDRQQIKNQTCTQCFWFSKKCTASGGIRAVVLSWRRGTQMLVGELFSVGFEIFVQFLGLKNNRNTT